MNSYIVLLLSAICLIFFITTLILGIFNYKSIKLDVEDEREPYSFLNQFPYEMQDNATMKYTLFFKFSSLCFALSFAIFGLYITGLLSTLDKGFLEYVMAFTFLFLALIFISLFSIDISYYRIHLFSTSLLFVLSICLYLLFGVYALQGRNDRFYPALGYINIIIAGLMLASLFITPLKRWMYLEHVQENGEVKYYRKKIAILPFMEWIFIILNIVLIILLTLCFK